MMADIYLSFDQPNSAFVQALKHDLELFTGLSVALECNDDWEDAEDCHLQEQLDKAKTLLMLATKHSNITAWVMGDGNSKGRRPAAGAGKKRKKDQFPSTISLPLTIDFSRNYEHGVNNLLCMIAQERNVLQRRCTQEETKEEVKYEEYYAAEDDGGRMAIYPAEENNGMPTRTPCFGSDPAMSSGQRHEGDTTYDSLLRRLKALELRTEQRRRKQAGRAKRTRKVLTA